MHATATAPLSKLPKFTPPQLAAFAAKTPKGAGWYYERKYDGYRMQITISSGVIRFFTRSGIDVSDKLGTLLPALDALRGTDMTLDGELCDGSDGDRTNLCMLNQTFHHGGPFRLYVFDLLKLDGQDVSGLPLYRRKVLLSEALSNLDDAGSVRLVPFQTLAGDALFKEMVDNRHEGIIAKRANAPYRAGQRSSDWIKVKVIQEGSFFIIGWQADIKKSIVKSLLVASRQDDEWIYRGRVGTGWTSAGRRTLFRTLISTQSSNPLFPVPVSGQVHWAEGTQEVLLRFADISHRGILRHPRFVDYSNAG